MKMLSLDTSAEFLLLYFCLWWSTSVILSIQIILIYYARHILLFFIASKSLGREWKGCTISEVHDYISYVRYFCMISCVSTTNMATTLCRRVLPNNRVISRFSQCHGSIRTNATYARAQRNPKYYLYGTAAATSIYFGWKWLESNAVVQAARPNRRMVSFGYFYILLTILIELL